MLPSYTINEDNNQYVTQVSFGSDTRYINGRISQRVFQIPLRIDYIITPDISIQYWGQPFISRGVYKDFRYVTDPTAKNFDNRFETLTSEQLTFDSGAYSVDEDRDGLVDYQLFNPDFSFIQWRSNLVARWEYIPGSQLFLVWSQDITQFGDVKDMLISGLRQGIADTKPQNIFLIKLTYRFIK